MATRIGTCNFISLTAARKYYAGQGLDHEDVGNKVDAGEIVIGKPAGPGHVTIDRDGRYILEDAVFVDTSKLHEATLSVEQRLLHALYTHNWEPRAYSGRGMFGKQCVAVSLTGESQLWTLARTVPVDVDAPHTDQLGKGLIAYWPNYEWRKDEGKGMPWCEPCGSYHHSSAPGCRAEHGPLLHFDHP